MKKFIAFAGHKAARIAIAFVALLLIGGGLVAQSTSLFKETAPAESGLEFYYEQIPANLEKSRTFLQYAADFNNLSQKQQEILSEHHEPVSAKESVYISDITLSDNSTTVVYKVTYLHKYARVTGSDDDFQNLQSIFLLQSTDSTPTKLATIFDFDSKAESSLRIAYWVNTENILITLEGLAIPNPKGVYLLDTKAMEVKKVPIHDRYISTPYYLGNMEIAYQVLEGTEPVNLDHFLGEKTWYKYNLDSKKESRLNESPLHTKELSNNLAPEVQDYFLMTTHPNGCTLPGAPIFNLPWPCNKAMCVERDGPQKCSTCNFDGHDINTEYADCNLQVGSNYVGACNSCPGITCGHTRPAIDFGDGGLYFQTGTPVLASADGEAQRRYEPSGAGNFVVIKHLMPGGGYTYSYYMHLATGTSPIVSSTTNWVTVHKGDFLGSEGNTGGNNMSAHYHFELKDVIGGGSFYPRFAEYGGCTPRTGYTYISRNIPTDGSVINGFDCNSVTTISCNTLLTNQSNTNSASRYATYGNGYHDWDETGPEKIYRITTTSTGTISATLSNVVYSSGNDLDVFILGPVTNCSDLDPLVHTRSTTSGLTATAANCPAGTYYIIVDGMNASRGSYSLQVNANCNTSSSSLPDLRDHGSTIAVSGNGRVITPTYRIANTGQVPSGGFLMREYLSTDGTLSSNDILLVTYSYQSQAPMTYHQFGFQHTIPTSISGGIYYLIFSIDYNNQVVESDETNNLYYFTAPLLVAANVVANPNNTDDTALEVTVTENSLPITEELLPTEVLESTTDGNQCLEFATHNGNEITISSTFGDGTRYQVHSLDGREICSGNCISSSTNCSVPTIGIYIVSIIDPRGNRCTQKLAIFD